MDSSKRGENKQTPANDRNDSVQSPQDEQAALQGQSTSSQSVNSDVSQGQFAKTLSTLNDNMVNMTEIMSQIWQRVDSGGKTARTKKRLQQEQNSSANSSESEPDEHTTKRRCPNREDDDSVSLAASDDEVRQLLNDTNNPQDNESSDLPDDGLLQELQAQFNEDKSLGPAVGERLAAIAANRWTEKLNVEELKEIHEKYKQPLNCEALRVSRINPEIWSQVSQHKKKADLRLSRLQQNVQKAVFATLQMADMLTAKDRPPALMDDKNDREALCCESRGISSQC